MTNKKNILFISLAVLALAGTLMLGLYLGGAFHSDDAEKTAIANGTRYAEEQDYSDVSESPNIAIPGYDTLRFVADKTQQTVNFHNPDENTCYFKMSLILEDGTTIWTSDLLEPGMAFNKIELSKPLEQGTYYNVILKYDCYSLKDQSQLNGAEITVTIEAL